MPNSTPSPSRTFDDPELEQLAEFVSNASRDRKDTGWDTASVLTTIIVPLVTVATLVYSGVVFWRTPEPVQQPALIDAPTQKEKGAQNNERDEAAAPLAQAGVEVAGYPAHEITDDAPALRMKQKIGIAWALFNSVSSASIAFDRDKFADVERSLLLAAQHDPTNVEVPALLARVYDDRGDNQKAEEQYRKALAIDAQHFGALAGMTTLLLDAKRCDDAAKFIERLKKSAPADKASEVAQREKRIPQCVADAKRAERSQPKR
jgi:Flp pilus assembly protein TadD